MRFGREFCSGLHIVLCKPGIRFRLIHRGHIDLLDVLNRLVKRFCELFSDLLRVLFDLCQNNQPIYRRLIQFTDLFYLFGDLSNVQGIDVVKPPLNEL